MSQSNNILELCLVVVDSDYLSIIDDRIQDLSNDTESLAMALSPIYIHDNANKSVIVAVRSALFANSELASIVSEIMSGLILLPQLEVKNHE